MRIMTVTIKARPHAKATNLSFLASIPTRLEYSGREIISSDVTIRIIAVAASQRLISDSDSGKFISDQAVII